MGSSHGRTTPCVVLHVGVPKSGTTFLQQGLWSNRRALRDSGVALPGARQRDMFLAAVEVREGYQFWGYPAEEIDGTWARVCREARAFPGTTILSHELLGGATAEQARRALAELDGVELHVVLTVRDLVRQATSEWQERIKNGSDKRFGKFQRRLLRQARKGHFASGFWRNQDPIGVLGRWAGGVAAERVHVVVAPQPGAEPSVLWHRFGAAVGFDAQSLDPVLDGAPTNHALGAAQISVLRRVNKALDRRIVQPDYARIVKSHFAERVLADQTADRPGAPPRLAAVLRGIAEERNAQILASGYQVHGDLAELLPEPAADGVSPDDVGDAEVMRSFAEAMAAMLVERAETQRQGLVRRAAQAQVEAVPPSWGRRIVRRLGSSSPG